MATEIPDFFLLKSALIAVLVLFVVYGLDIRKTDKESKQFVSTKKILLMKASAFSLVSLYLMSILLVDTCDHFDFASLLFTMTGVSLIIWAKKALGNHFTWTGYYFPDSEVVKTGPYRYLNHPLYTGVYLFETGAIIRYFKFTAQTHYQPILLFIGFVPLLYAVGFNLVMSRYERKIIDNKK